MPLSPREVFGLICIFLFVSSTVNDLLPNFIQAKWQLNFEDPTKRVYWFKIYAPLFFFGAYLLRWNIHLDKPRNVLSLSLIGIFGVWWATDFGRAKWLQWTPQSLITWSSMFFVAYLIAWKRLNTSTAFYASLFSTLAATTLYEIPLNPLGHPTFLLYQPVFPLFVATNIFALAFFFLCLMETKKPSSRMTLIMFAVTIVYLVYNWLLWITLPSGLLYYIPKELVRVPTAMWFSLIIFLWK